MPSAAPTNKALHDRTQPCRASLALPCPNVPRLVLPGTAPQCLASLAVLSWTGSCLDAPNKTPPCQPSLDTPCLTNAGYRQATPDLASLALPPLLRLTPPE